MKPRACYIAGPMRGRPGFNFPAFFAAEFELTKVGWQVFNPARMDVQTDAWPNVESYTLTLPEHRRGLTQLIKPLDGAKFDPEDFRKYARRDCRVLIDYLRAEEGDALVILPGHEESIGATAEKAVARWVALPIITLEDALNA